MTSNKINVVRAFIGTINRRSPSEISELMTVDHTFVDSGGRVESGRQKMVAAWSEYFRAFPDFTIAVETILGNDEVVAAFGSTSGTYNGKRGLVAENRIEMPAAWRAPSCLPCLPRRSARESRQPDTSIRISSSSAGGSGYEPSSARGTQAISWPSTGRGSVCRTHLKNRSSTHRSA